jgi:5-enolpyruvylshikimate-3-phosphate synthase
MLNDMAYAKAQSGPAWKSSALDLSVERMPEFIDVSGPADTRLTRLLTAAAAASEGSAAFPAAVLNDPLYELVQALAQAGAGVERSEDGVTVHEGGLKFGERTIFAGADELNLYIIMALLAPHAGRYTISGAGAAKAAGLSPVMEAFSRMGVRVTCIEPKSTSLPARVETPGIEKAEIRLPADFPADAATALAAAGPAFPEGMTMAWETDWPGAGFVEEARAVFRILGVAAEEGETFLNIPAGYRVSGEYEPPLDPALTAHLLALAKTTGRRVRVGGRWPETAAGAATAAMLESAGLSIKVAQEAVTAEPAGEKAETIDAAALPACMPLAVTLALADGARIRPPENYDRLAAEDLANAFGREYRESDGLAEIGGDIRPDVDTYLAPTAMHALAALIASPARSGVRLVNPGILSEVWPGVVQIYKTLFRAPGAGPKERKEDGRAAKGRRIKL